MEFIVLIIDLLILSFCFLSVIKFKNFVSPIILFSVPLILQYFIYFFLYRDIAPISDLTLTLYILCLLGFILGNFSFDILPNSRNYLKQRETKNDASNYSIVYITLITGILFMIMSQMYLNSIGVGVSQYLSQSLSIREAIVSNLGSMPFYVVYGKYFLLFSISTIWYDFLSGNRKISKLFMNVLLVILFLNAFLVFSRTDLLINILPIITIYFRCKIFKNKEGYGKKFSRVQSVAFLAFMGSLVFFMNSLRQVEQHVGFFTRSNSLMQYIGYPIVAFDRWILPYAGKSGQLLSVEPLNKLIIKIGLINPTKFNFAPLGQFNVYSYLRAPFMDFGILGAVVVTFFMGMLSQYLYNKFKNGNKRWVIFYSVYTYGIIMSFFDWQFTITTFAYLIIYLLMISIHVSLSKGGINFD